MGLDILRISLATVILLSGAAYIYLSAISFSAMFGWPLFFYYIGGSLLLNVAYALVTKSTPVC